MTVADPAWRVKTRPCPFQRRGNCVFSEKCNFIHDQDLSSSWSPHEATLISEETLSPRSRSPRSPRLSSLLDALKGVIGEDPDEEEIELALDEIMEKKRNQVPLVESPVSDEMDIPLDAATAADDATMRAVRFADSPASSSSSELSSWSPGQVHSVVSVQPAEADNSPSARFHPPGLVHEAEASVSVSLRHSSVSPVTSQTTRSGPDQIALPCLPPTSLQETSEHLCSPPHSSCSSTDRRASQSLPLSTGLESAPSCPTSPKNSSPHPEYSLPPTYSSNSDARMPVSHDSQPASDMFMPPYQSPRSSKSPSSHSSRSSCSLLSPFDLPDLQLNSHPTRVGIPNDGDPGFENWAGPLSLIMSPPRSPARSSTFDLLASPFGTPSSRLMSPGFPSRVPASPLSAGFAPPDEEDEIAEMDLSLDSPSVHAQRTARAQPQVLAHSSLEENTGLSPSDADFDDPYIFNEVETNTARWDLSSSENPTSVFIGMPPPSKKEVKAALDRVDKSPVQFLEANAAELEFNEGDVSGSTSLLGRGVSRPEGPDSDSEMIEEDYEEDNTAHLAYLSSPNAVISYGPEDDDTLQSLYSVYQDIEAEKRDATLKVTPPPKAIVSPPKKGRPRVFTPPPAAIQGHSRSGNLRASTSSGSSLLSVLRLSSPEDEVQETSKKVPFGFRHSTSSRRNSTVAPLESAAPSTPNTASSQQERRNDSPPSSAGGLRPLRLSTILNFPPSTANVDNPNGIGSTRSNYRASISSVPTDFSLSSKPLLSNARSSLSLIPNSHVPSHISIPDYDYGSNDLMKPPRSAPMHHAEDQSTFYNSADAPPRSAPLYPSTSRTSVLSQRDSVVSTDSGRRPITLRHSVLSSRGRFTPELYVASTSNPRTPPPNSRESARSSPHAVVFTRRESMFTPPPEPSEPRSSVISRRESTFNPPSASPRTSAFGHRASVFDHQEPVISPHTSSFNHRQSAHTSRESVTSPHASSFSPRTSNFRHPDITSVRNSHTYRPSSRLSEPGSSIEEEEDEFEGETIRRSIHPPVSHSTSPLVRSHTHTPNNPNLLFAIASDDAEEVKQVLRESASDPNESLGPQSALNFALTNDQLSNKLDIVKTLLSYGAKLKEDENKTEEDGKVDPATKYYVEKAESSVTQKASALMQKSFFRPLSRVRYGIIGQDRALEQLFRMLSIHSQQITVAPIVILLCGPSGLGKSLLAQKFGSALDVPTHTVNMTTLRTSHDLWQSYSMSPQVTVPRCTLLEFLVNNEGKRCVVVLDEIEKTEDPKALWSLLVPWELGQCSFEANSLNVDVRNVIWLATSNIGQDLILEHHASRKDPDELMAREEYVRLMAELRPRVSDRLGASILSRVTTLLPFVPFTHEERRAIAAEALHGLSGELIKSIAPPIFESIVEGALAGFVPAEGARSLYRAVSNLLVDVVDLLELAE